MDYSAQYKSILETLYVHNLEVVVKMNLDKMMELDKALNYPSKQFKSIHVTGTNGKGSTAYKIAKSLEKSGYKTGLYTSPHLSCLRERTCINSEMINEKRFVELIQRVYECADRIKNCTFFEMTTIMSYLYFAEEHVDIAVIEVGCGGRLDATNIINSEMSIITSIGLDHQGILGNTIEEIATEKSGIIKTGKPVILGPDCPHKLIKCIASKQSSPAYIVENHGQTFDETNALIAECALKVLNTMGIFSIPSYCVSEGIQLRPNCRFQQLSIPFEGKTCQVVLDGGHNILAIQNFIKTLQYTYPNKCYKYICGFCADKNISICLQELFKVISVSNFSCISASHPRAMPANQLREIIKQTAINQGYIWKDTYCPIDTLSAVIQRELTNIQDNEVLIIAGSLYIMAEVRYALGIHEPIDLRNIPDSKDISNSIMFPHEKPKAWN
ncbi:hypothetical protein WA158_008166 [Blastocystis sp. Blastoise]